MSLESSVRQLNDATVALLNGVNDVNAELQSKVTQAAGHAENASTQKVAAQSAAGQAADSAQAALVAQSDIQTNWADKLAAADAAAITAEAQAEIATTKAGESAASAALAAALAGGSGFFDNVAAMQAADLSVGIIVQTSGYHAAGDGGGAMYQIVAANTGTQDGGSLITLNNGRQAQALFPNNVVRLSQFGAKGIYEPPRTAPDSLGSWTDTGGGNYRLQWNGSAAITPMTFTTTPGSAYYFSCKRISALPGNVGVYDLALQQANGVSVGDFGQWYSNYRAPASGSTAATGTTMKLVPLLSAPIDVTLGDFQFVRAEDDASALNAALAWFGTSKLGRLIIDIPCYLFGATAVTFPANVSLELSGQGILMPAGPLVINSQLVADNRAILPKTASVTFGPQQASIKPNWFGL